MKRTIAIIIEEIIVAFLLVASNLFFVGIIIMAISQTGSLLLLLKLCLLSACYLTLPVYAAFKLTDYFLDLDHKPFRIWKR
jgi:hypothetical protein